MDNGTLVFIIIIEAVIIVWQASKLKQYQKIEKLFSSGVKPSGAGSAATTSAAQSSDAVAVASVSGAVADPVLSGVDADLLAVPGVDPEANIEEAKRVQLVMARCRYAEFYLEQLDDDYERGQFKRIVDSCTTTARNIQDPFFRASALHPIIVLLDRAEWPDVRDQLLNEVDDDLVKQRINEELQAAAVSTS